MGELATRRSAGDLARFNEAIAKASTAQDFNSIFGQIKSLETMAQSLGVLERKIAELVELEAATYRRMMEVIGDWRAGKTSECLFDNWHGRGIAKKYITACEYLSNLTEKEREAVYKEAIEDGTDLTAHIGRRVQTSTKYRQIMSLYQMRLTADKEYKNNGRVNLDAVFYVDGRKRASDVHAADSVKNRAKDDLLRQGAIGVGNSVYVDADRATPAEMRQAVKIRIRSICADVRALLRLYLKCPEAFELMGENGNSLERRIIDLVLHMPAQEALEEATA